MEHLFLNTSRSPGLVKGQWSREEDDILTALVNEGHKNWGSLAARIPGRTSKQCRERWCHHLDPRIVKGEWTEEEDRTIVSMHDKMGNKWATIAQVGSPKSERAQLGGRGGGGGITKTNQPVPRCSWTLCLFYP